MQRKYYEKLEMGIVYVQAQDIVTLSGGAEAGNKGADLGGDQIDNRLFDWN